MKRKELKRLVDVLEEAGDTIKKIKSYLYYKFAQPERYTKRAHQFMGAAPSVGAEMNMIYWLIIKCMAYIIIVLYNQFLITCF
jgi:hypothetical protein